MPNIYNLHDGKFSEIVNLIKDNTKSINDPENLRDENENGENIPQILFSNIKNPESSNPDSDAKDLIEDKDTNNAAEKKNEKHFIFTPQFQVYVTHFLSSWGDRMWMFAGGLFLIEITPGSLRLVAIYEASRSLTVIFLGSAVGRWVDRASRLTAAKSSLILQNLMVCACTFLLCMMTTYKSFFHTSLNGWGDTAAQAGVVALTCVAQIGTLASKLAIEKDWIVVISEQSDAQLSTMNSVLRTVDLSTEMMAPVLVGFIMSSSGMVAGGIVIAAWNLGSFFIEYGLLNILYKKVVALQKPKQDMSITFDNKTVKIVTRIKEKVKDAAIIWKSYFHHSIRDAGLGLAVLYMTVLALDNYSRAYVYENGVSKGILGILTAFASLSGILGSIAFPFLRRKIGVLATGIFGFTFESLCLIFCVASVFAPGSFFNPNSIFNDDSSYVASTPPSIQNQEDNVTLISTIGYSNASLDSSVYNVTQNSQNYVGTQNSDEIDFNYTSVILLLVGIVTSRFGLWLADLTVTQILQEEVAENERGGINGVQSSLNQSFSLLRSLLLIVLPTLATYGYLILLSFIFVVSGTVLFSIYSYKKRKRELIIGTNAL